MRNDESEYARNIGFSDEGRTITGVWGETDITARSALTVFRALRLSKARPFPPWQVGCTNARVLNIIRTGKSHGRVLCVVIFIVHRQTKYDGAEEDARVFHATFDVIN